MIWVELWIDPLKRHNQLWNILKWGDFLQRGTRAPCLQMDVQGFSRETVANATAASGLDLHYAKERDFFADFLGPQKLWTIPLSRNNTSWGMSRAPLYPHPPLPWWVLAHVSYRNRGTCWKGVGTLDFPLYSMYEFHVVFLTLCVERWDGGGGGGGGWIK